MILEHVYASYHSIHSFSDMNWKGGQAASVLIFSIVDMKEYIHNYETRFVNVMPTPASWQ